MSIVKNFTSFYFNLISANISVSNKLTVAHIISVLLFSLPFFTHILLIKNCCFFLITLKMSSLDEQFIGYRHTGNYVLGYSKLGHHIITQ